MAVRHKSDRKLNERQLRFVDEYLVDLNASAAYLRAGYKGCAKGVEACNLLADPRVQALLAVRRKEQQRRTQVTADRVINELARIAFGDLRKVVTWGEGGFKVVDSDKLSDDDAATVSEVSEEDTQFGTRRKIKTNDKVAALKLLGQHFALFTEKQEHSGPGGQPLAPPVFHIDFGNGGPGSDKP